MVKKASAPVPRLPRLVKTKSPWVAPCFDKPTHVNRERLAKTIFKPWHAARIFESGQKDLIKRERELTLLINKIQSELILVKMRIKGKED